MPNRFNSTTNTSSNATTSTTSPPHKMWQSYLRPPALKETGLAEEMLNIGYLDFEEWMSSPSNLSFVGNAAIANEKQRQKVTNK